ncbi:MAG: S41 family peptidase [Candidatus Gracilibacteria bacterium]
MEDGAKSVFKPGKTITRGEAAYYLYLIDTYTPSAKLTITYLTQSNGSTDEITDEKTFNALSGVFSSLKNKYLYQSEIDKNNLLYDAIEGMLKPIKDEYTVFQKPMEPSLLDTLSGEYEGIGMSLDLINDNIVVVSPFKDAPAEKAGIKSGDIIIKVDRKSVVGDPVESVAAKLRGKKGTKVKITVQREGKELSFTVTRDVIQNESVDYEIKTYNGKNIAYINMINFGEETYTEFLDAANKIIADKTINGVILDLRNNPGGYIDVAIDIISLFTNEIKTAVKLKYANGNITEYKTSGDGTLKGYKTAILINKGSASASEILAGALKDYGIATLIGETSFGKGSVQEIHTYEDGSLFKYTISYWLTPNGTSIEHTGITPDTIIQNTGTTDTQLNKALEQF